MCHKYSLSLSNIVFSILHGKSLKNFYYAKKSVHLTPHTASHNRRFGTGYGKTNGSALVLAVFIIVVISLRGATLVKILASSQQNVVYEVLGTRAYATAQSGIQWKLSQVFPLNAPAAACATQSTPSFNNVNGLKQCNVAVSCSDFVVDSIRYYTITATGKCQAGDTVTSRTLEVDARSLP